MPMIEAQDKTSPADVPLRRIPAVLRIGRRHMLFHQAVQRRLFGAKKFVMGMGNTRI